MTRKAGSYERSGEPAGLAAAPAKPKLVFFYASTSGRCRRTEAHLAHALQRRRNHAAFDLVRVDVEQRPDLAERFAVEAVPTFVVIEQRRVVRRIVSPRSATELEHELEPWLRGAS